MLLGISLVGSLRPPINTNFGCASPWLWVSGKTCSKVNGHIDINIEDCISNYHVYGTLTLVVTFTFSNGASHLQDNYLVLVVRRNPRPVNQMTFPTVISS
jgi:hypothetical protein